MLRTVLIAERTTVLSGYREWGRLWRTIGHKSIPRGSCSSAPAPWEHVGGSVFLFLIHISSNHFIENIVDRSPVSGNAVPVILRIIGERTLLNDSVGA